MSCSLAMKSRLGVVAEPFNIETPCLMLNSHDACGHSIGFYESITLQFLHT
jgi:hypothetical protein